MSEKKNININTTAIRSFFLNFIIPIVCLSITALLGFFVFYPSFQSLKPLKKEVADKNLLSTQLSTKLTNLENLKEFKSVVDENSALVESVLVNEPMVPQLLTQIDQVARESGLTVTKLNYSFSEPKAAPVAANSAPEDLNNPAPPEDPFKTVDVSLGTEGNFDQLVTFLSNMENSARLVNVDTFRYTLAEKESSTYLNMSFSLKSPYMKVESKAVTDEAINLSLSDKQFVDTINNLKKLKFYNITVEGIKEEYLNEEPETPETSESTPSESAFPVNETPSSPFE